ncbi:radical SAM protein [Acidisphaera rubrifaciens]|uniref:Radical SAM domain protein n=1 Tax=Acidisphaera rubrifaciens HS-AP3 TaxID=1231350 RepID=A0A0D6P8T9_9PROT|nr:radical SAM protein [Acidisphaera rubrifaciens]GAN77761.1 radical SAM domain protein [Acidisphaera rubrifaciens HS-AP3]
MTRPDALPAAPPPLAPGKFRDPYVTARGETRATVAPATLRTLWINTGTLCNITCANCYIESSPRNDALVYPTVADILPYLDEAAALGTGEIGFTGGEPFMNRHLPAMLDAVLERGFRALVLTNAMKPMRNHEDALRAVGARAGGRLTLRVSLDHYAAERHDVERGAGSFAQALDGLAWLSRNGFIVHVAGRSAFGEGEGAMRAGYAALFAAHGIPIDADDPVALMLFPEMDARVDVPEITTACWGILGKRPDAVMCATSRMVVKRRGADAPTVVACTLLPYDPQFDLGPTLAGALRPVALNHPHCAKFCVLGGAACAA